VLVVALADHQPRHGVCDRRLGLDGKDVSVDAPAHRRPAGLIAGEALDVAVKSHEGAFGHPTGFVEVHGRLTAYQIDAPTVDVVSLRGLDKAVDEVVRVRLERVVNLERARPLGERPQDLNAGRGYSEFVVTFDKESHPLVVMLVANITCIFISRVTEVDIAITTVPSEREADSASPLDKKFGD